MVMLCFLGSYFQRLGAFVKPPVTSIVVGFKPSHCGISVSHVGSSRIMPFLGEWNYSNYSLKPPLLRGLLRSPFALVLRGPCKWQSFPGETAPVATVINAPNQPERGEQSQRPQFWSWTDQERNTWKYIPFWTQILVLAWWHVHLIWSHFLKVWN